MNENWVHRWHGVCRRITILSFAGLLAALVAGWSVSQVPAPVRIAGNWEGESVCTIPNSPCHDEHVVYRISQQKDAPGKYTISADKIVDGRPVNMGDLHCNYDQVKGNLRCEKPGVWEFSVIGEALTGTLKLDDGTLYRKVSLKRQK
jgi:hypothetical protein